MKLDVGDVNSAITGTHFSCYSIIQYLVFLNDFNCILYKRKVENSNEKYN